VGDDEQPPQALVERRLLDQGLELAGGVLRAAGPQPGLDPVAGRVGAGPLQPLGRGPGPGRGRELDEGAAPPLALGVFQQGDGIVGRGRGLASLGDQGLEAVGVELARLDHDHVAGGTGDDAVGPEAAPQLGDVGLDRLGLGPGLVGRRAGPQVVDDALDGHDPVGVDQEAGDEASPLRAADIEVAVSDRQPEWPEDAELDHLASPKLVRAGLQT
jgi:hypothetical protein